VAWWHHRGVGVKIDLILVQGDSGGPFSVKKDGKFYEVGVVSFGEGKK
jgi:hypothetical protein